jgi:hypothetical protein
MDARGWSGGVMDVDTVAVFGLVVSVMPLYLR